MADFVKLTSRDLLPPPGEAREFPLGDKMVCVANVEGMISAMDNVCIHRGGPIGQGTIEGGQVVCPWHGWAWDPQTGEAAHGVAKVATYPLRIDGEDVLVEIGS